MKRTMMIENLEEATFRLYVYNHCKYNVIDGEETIINYTGVTSWDIIEGGKEVEEID